ncbi:MAG: NepR family anti-sigma factor [Pseudochelatococcus sp.]|uniref:NepR family anti-sigma factor n=1 Tax=Pseudochelatococcus sp. TaxID=2020869 RepID=UPI003D8F5C8B
MKDTGRSGKGQRSQADGAGAPGAGADHEAAQAGISADRPERQADKRTPDKQALPLAPDVQNRIGEQLQMLYSDLLTQATPDRFLKLLDDLDRKSRQH